MAIFLYWWLGTFLYFKIAITAAEFGYDDYQLTVLSSLLLATIFCLTIYSLTKHYAEKLLFLPETNGEIKRVIAVTIRKFLIYTFIFGAISRLIIFGFSNNLSEEVRDGEEFWLMTILLFPIILHYAMCVFATLDIKPPK